MYARAFYALNKPFHNSFRGNDEQKSPSEGYFPHLLPLKEGGEETLFICLKLVLASKTHAPFENMCNPLQIGIFHVPNHERYAELCTMREAQICTHLKHIKSIDVSRYVQILCSLSLHVLLLK